MEEDLKRKIGVPFQNMKPDNWVNLALAATLSFYLVLIMFFIFNTRICGILASDYCAYWSAGRIINERSISDVYNLELLTQYQKEIYPHGDSAFFEPFGIMYPPIFLLPFALFAFLSLPYSFLVWTLINVIGFVCYLRFFAWKAAGHKLPFRLLLMIMLCLPFFINLREGQVNVWLVICIGEFIRWQLLKKPFRAGMWLAGWLIKPQLLILIVLHLILKHSAKVLLGFIFLSGIILILSIGLINLSGVLNLMNIIQEASAGGVTSNISVMMNWRMLGWHIGDLTSLSLGRMVTIFGSLVTVGVTLFFFSKDNKREPTKDVIALLGIIAATLSISWHAHFHTSLVLLPPMIYLILNDRFNNKIFITWIFVPIIIQFFNRVLLVFIDVGFLGTIFSSAIRLTTGLRGLILNLLILFWSLIQYSSLNDKLLEKKV